MPFALAHPAAVLPFKRFSPRFLSWPALVVGSLTPDVAYLSGPLELDDVSHAFCGSAAFGVPAGLLMLLSYRWIRPWLASLLSARRFAALLPVVNQPLGTPWTIIPSLISGTWLHVLWDAFTHKGGWFVERLPLLQVSLLEIGGRNFRMHNALWYLCSVLGVLLLCLAAARWRAASVCKGVNRVAGRELAVAFALAAAVIPMSLLHHLWPGLVGNSIVGLLSLTLGVLAVLYFGASRRLEDDTAEPR